MFLQYVRTCFSNSSLFHKALKEAFESFCNKNVTGSSSAELMANFCDNLLKKVGNLPQWFPHLRFGHRLPLFCPSSSISLDWVGVSQGGTEKLSDDEIEATLDKVRHTIPFALLESGPEP